MPENLPLVIIGGNSLVAPYLMENLRVEGRIADVISRNTVPVPEGFTFTALDLRQDRNWIAPENAVIISLLPLWVLATYLPRFIGVNSIIALGSTSLFSKVGSSDSVERATAAGLEVAENNLREWCRRSNVHGTLLRPTMIYDGIHDNNIARMARFIRRFHCLPLAAPAKGLRQPIHAGDVARAILKTLGNSSAEGKALNIAGGEVLTYRAMAEKVFDGLGVKRRLIMLPESWLEKSFRWGSRAGIVREKAFGSSVFRRMNEDLVFEVAEGLRLLDYQPRGFLPRFDVPHKDAPHKDGL
ncbi:MAG: NAD-dependent epimerase/dehydratase [Pseudomonadota bacterium]|nr:NAD-dependent epimerase/dehydratase [Pseudomonadota bacterium]